jgi:dTDP-glucose 4,6-dehydratase
MTDIKKTILITGGAGFIGSHVVRLFATKYPHYKIVNLDALTYAGNLANLKDVQNAPNYTFEKGDITDETRITALFAQYKPDGIIHLAAESHVDRSIMDPLAFVRTNVLGTANLLHVAAAAWKGAYEGKRFYHVSTDALPTPPLKPPPTISSWPGTTPTACPLSSPTAPTTTAVITSRKS